MGAPVSGLFCSTLNVWAAATVLHVVISHAHCQILCYENSPLWSMSFKGGKKSTSLSLSGTSYSWLFWWSSELNETWWHYDVSSLLFPFLLVCSAAVVVSYPNVNSNLNFTNLDLPTKLLSFLTPLFYQFPVFVIWTCWQYGIYKLPLNIMVWNSLEKIESVTKKVNCIENTTVFLKVNLW